MDYQDLIYEQSLQEYNQGELQISLFECSICRSYKKSLSKLELIEQTIYICSNCQAYITNAIINIKRNFKKLNAVYKNKIELVIDSNKIFYKLKWQQCQICNSWQILSQITNCMNFFCLNCIQNYIQNQRHLHIYCPYQTCNQFMSVLQFKQWVKEKYYFFCPNKNCKTILQLIPFQNMESKIIQSSINVSQCSSCQILFCSKCWKKFKGTITQHQGICKQDQQIISLLQKQNILQCPKCKMYSEQDCKVRFQKFQECALCKTVFCLFCKNADLQLFSRLKPFRYACNCRSNFIKSKIIQIVLYITAMFYISSHFSLLI